MIAVEIKRTKNISKKDTKGLLSFKRDYPEADLYLMYGGEKTYYYDSIQAIPVKEMLFHLPTLLSKSISNASSQEG